MSVGAEFKIYFVGVGDGFGDFFTADKVRQFASDIGRQAEFTVRKSPRARKARGYVAVFAVYAMADFGFRAASVFNRFAFFDDCDFAVGAELQKLQSGENARRARANDDDVFLHVSSIEKLPTARQQRSVFRFTTIYDNTANAKSQRKNKNKPLARQGALIFNFVIPLFLPKDLRWLPQLRLALRRRFSF